MFARSFAIQGSWNYRTLLGNGFAFVMLPALRRIYADRPDQLRDAVVRHQQVFNSHPYLVGVAAGAVARLESEAAEPVVIERFKSAVRGSLGSIGDRLVWAGWRPVCGLLAVTLAFAGVPWWIVAIVFLLIYNAGHIFVRVWGFQLGFRHGRAVAERLRHSRVASTQKALAVTGAFMIGAALPLTLSGLLEGGFRPTAAWITGAVAAAVLGLRFGAAVRTPVVLALAMFALFGLVLGVTG